MSPINKYFDKVFVISLINRPDRRSAVTESLKKKNIEFEFYDAIEFGWANSIVEYSKGKGTNIFKVGGEISCLMSHYACIKIAKERGYKNILIFEDDTVLLKNFNLIIQNYLDALPEDWNMLYLSCNIWEFTERNKWFKEPFLRHANKSNSACAYAVNSNFYDKILTHLDNNFNVVDVEYMKLQNNPDNKIYFCIPNLTAQGWSKSDLIGKETNYFHPGILSYNGKRPEDYE